MLPKDVLHESGAVEADSRLGSAIDVPLAEILIAGGEYAGRTGAGLVRGSRAAGVRLGVREPARTVTPCPPRVATSAIGPRLARTAGGRSWEEKN